MVEMRRPPHNYFDVALIAALADAFEAPRGQSSAAAPSCCARRASRSAPAPTSPTETPPRLSAALARHQPAVRRGVRGCSRAASRWSAAVQGPAVGGGLGLALVADFRVTCAEARFSANFNRLGFHPGFGLSVTLPRLVGVQQAALLFYTGRRIDGRKRHRIGLADVLVAQDQVRTRAHRARARDRGVGADRSAVHARDLACRAGRADPRRRRPREPASRTAHFTTADFREGVAAMAARREPQFKGE